MKSEQDKLEKLLKSELKKEAEEILGELKEDEALTDVSVPADMDSKLQQMIQQFEKSRELEEQLSEMDREALRSGREQQILKGIDELDVEAAEEFPVLEDVQNAKAAEKIQNGKRKKKKTYLLIGVAAVLVLAMGMTSIGGTPFWARITKKNIGEREMMQIDSQREGGEENNNSLSDEVSIYQEIKEVFGVDAVRFGYVPDGIRFLEGDVDEVIQSARMIFEYGDTIIEYSLFFNYRDQSSGYDIEDRLIKQEVQEISGVEVTLNQYLLEEDLYKYAAVFEYENVQYVINAPIEEAELRKIVENLKFF